jgi:hypothetical protein
MTMDVKDKQPAIIEFLLLKRCARGEIVIHLRKMSDSTTYCGASVFRWISEISDGNEEL